MVKVATKTVENQEAVLNVEIEAAELEKSIQTAYRRLVQQVRIPGFRRGKAPINIVERMVGAQRLYSEALRDLLPDAIPAALQEAGVNAADVPAYDVTQLERGKPLLLRLTVPLQPEVELGDYRAISVPHRATPITDEQVQSALQHVQEQRTTWARVQGRPAQHGDSILADVRLASAGQVLQARDDLEIQLGRNSFPAGFDQQVEGMLIGEERTFDLPLRTQEQLQPAATGGTPEPPQMCEVMVRLKGILEPHVPALDDELARSLVPPFESLEALRQELRRRLEQEAELGAQYAHEERVVAVAVEQSRVEIPRTLIERQAESLARDRVRRLEEQGIPLARYLAAIGRTEVDWRRDLVQDAEAIVRRHLVLEKIAAAEQIQVTAEELAAEVAQAAESRLDRAEQTRIRESLDQPDARERLTTSLRLRKTVQFLADVAAANAARGVPPSHLSSERAAPPDVVGGAVVPAPAESV